MRLPALLVVVIAVSACQATVRVGVSARRDGSGTVTVTVTLDREAAGTVPDLAQQLRTGDLQQAGWTVVGPRPAGNGGVEVQAAKPFRSRAEAIQVLGELSGGAPGNGSGPFNSFEIDERHGILTSTTTFHGIVDLTCGLRCFGDAPLAQQLGGADLGVDPAKLQRQTGIVLARIFVFQVAVNLPGTLRSSNAPVRAGGAAQWQFKLGDKVELVATSRSWNSTPVVVLDLAVVAGLVLLVLLAILVRRRVVVRRRRARLHFRR